MTRVVCTCGEEIEFACMDCRELAAELAEKSTECRELEASIETKDTVIEALMVLIKELYK